MYVNSVSVKKHLPNWTILKWGRSLPVDWPIAGHCCCKLGCHTESKNNGRQDLCELQSSDRDKKSCHEVVWLSTPNLLFTKLNFTVQRCLRTREEKKAFGGYPFLVEFGCPNNQTPFRLCSLQKLYLYMMLALDHNYATTIHWRWWNRTLRPFPVSWKSHLSSSKPSMVWWFIKQLNPQNMLHPNFQAEPRVSGHLTLKQTRCQGVNA